MFKRSLLPTFRRSTPSKAIGSGSTRPTNNRLKLKPLTLFLCLMSIPLLITFFFTSNGVFPNSSSESSSLNPPNTKLRQLEKTQLQQPLGSTNQVASENAATLSKVKAAAPALGSPNLPSAKSLLTKPPPFDDSQIIKLSDTLITSPNTVVTGYYRVKSKFKPGRYDSWMRNMLSLQDAMVIFTSAELVPQIQSLRSHAKNRTVIVPLELEQLPIGTLYTPEFWQLQLDRDPEKGIHKSYELFWIWLSKSWWVSQAIRLNIYQSDLFVWSDIGCFREEGYNFKTMIQHREQVPQHEMIQMAHHTPNPPKDTVYFNDKYKRKPNFYHSGSQMAAYLPTWKIFHEKFLDTIDGFLERNMIIVEDQAILQSVCLRFPELCAYIPFNQVSDNHYFGLRHVLHNGGNYTLWRNTKQ